MKDFKPGARYAINLGGVQMATAPSTIVPAPPEVAEDVRHYRDSELAVTRLHPYGGAPDVVTKRKWAISWDSLYGPDLGHLAALVAARGLNGGLLDFCPWMYDAEAFWIQPAMSFFGVLQRRSALAAIPSANWPVLAGSGIAEFGPLLYAFDTATSTWVADTTLQLSTNSLNPYRTSWSCSPARTASGGGEQAVIFYVPVYRTAIPATQQSLSQIHGEGFTLNLGE